ncbi:hypothetical protein Ana3638_09610 [Anaerocolumna sedimenticola]|uniref:Uncharacterized protein n=1 Tax=Anaerocolumna sedimenticola TaxID=2696063 RepID=A0A6P1TLG2_9FIRM|nr:hypothetical protein [Anaerocolumna sedimenticola]QHQ60999.1 hypothetical protein Ana3638_09610 [Anaerocolumna sedimenticola]
MKKLVKTILILLYVSSLLGCQYKDRDSGSGSDQTETAETVDNNAIPKDKTQDVKEESVTGGTSDEPADYKPVTGDNLTVASEFAKDLLDENFPKLKQAYQYDEKMKTAITDEDTKRPYYSIILNTVKWKK